MAISDTQTATPVTRRPFGVLVLAIADLIFVGGFSIIVALSYPLIVSNYTILDSAVATAQALFGVTIVWLAVRTLQQRDQARCQLIRFVTAYQVLLIVNVISIGFTVGMSETVLAKILGTTGRCLFWISINRWYFNRPSVLAWFQQTRRGSDAMPLQWTN